MYGIGGIYGVQGISSSGIGGYFSSALSTGYGVEGNNTAGGYGVYGTSTGTGVGVYGSGATSGYGLYGSAGSSGYGVYGDAGSSGYGVYGLAGSSGYGVYGNAGASGFSIYGNGSSGTAVFGDNRSQTTGGHAAVNGQTADPSGYGGYFANSGTGGNDYAGYFSGNVKITGALTVTSCAGCGSDVRLKKNVEPLTGALEKLLLLKGVTFQWKNPEEHEGDSGTVFGFLAQEVEKVFPSWVKQEGYKAPDGKWYKTLDTKQ